MLVFDEVCVAVWYCAVLLMVCGGRFAFTFTWNVTVPETPAATDGMIAVTVPAAERKSMPGGNVPACSTPSEASVSTVAPDTLHRPEPATYVMPAGSASVICTLVAVAVPELVYDRVTVIGAAEGDGPLVTDNDLVTLITEFATVVVSVLVSVVGVVSATVTVMRRRVAAVRRRRAPCPRPRSGRSRPRRSARS